MIEVVPIETVGRAALVWRRGFGSGDPQAAAIAWEGTGDGLRLALAAAFVDAKRGTPIVGPNDPDVMITAALGPSADSGFRAFLAWLVPSLGVSTFGYDGDIAGSTLAGDADGRLTIVRLDDESFTLDLIVQVDGPLPRFEVVELG